MKRATKRRKRHLVPGPAGLLQQRQQFLKHRNDYDPNHDASNNSCYDRNSIGNTMSHPRTSSSSLLRKDFGRDAQEEECTPEGDDNCGNDDDYLFHLSDDSKRGKSFSRQTSQKIHEHVQIWDAMCVALNRILPTWSGNNFMSSFYDDPYSNLQLRKALGGDYTLLSDIPHLNSLKIPKIVFQIHYIYSHGHCNYTVEVLDESVTKPEIGWLSQDLIRNHPEWIRAGTVFLCCNVSLAVFHNERNVNNRGSHGTEYDGRSSNCQRRRTGVESFDRMLVLGEENIVFAWTKHNVSDVTHEEYLNLLERRSEVEQELMIMVGHDDVDDDDVEVGDLEDEDGRNRSEDFEEDIEEILGKEIACENTSMSRSVSTGTYLENPYKKKAFTLDPWSNIGGDKSSTFTVDSRRASINQEKSSVINHQTKENTVLGERSQSVSILSSDDDHIQHYSTATVTVTAPAITPTHNPPIHDAGSNKNQEALLQSISSDQSNDGSRLVVPDQTIRIIKTSSITETLDHAVHVVEKGVDQVGFESYVKEKRTAATATIAATNTSTIQNPYVTNILRRTIQNLPHPQKDHKMTSKSTVENNRKEDHSSFDALPTVGCTPINNALHNQEHPTEKNQLPNMHASQHASESEVSSVSLRRSTSFEIPNKISPSTMPNKSAFTNEENENATNQYQPNSIWTNIQQSPMDINVFNEDLDGGEMKEENTDVDKTMTPRQDGSSLDKSWNDGIEKSDNALFGHPSKSITFAFENIEESDLEAFDED